MDKLKVWVAIKMANRRQYGHKLINLSDLLKWVPSHLRGEAKNCIEELYKEGFLNKRPGVQGEFRYSLRVDKKREIDKLIEEER